MVFVVPHFLKRLVRWACRHFSIITVTLAIHGIIGGVIVFVFEVFVVDIHLGNWLDIRLLYNTVLFAEGEYCQLLTDYLRLKFQGNSIHPIRQAAADTLALALYKIPLFAFSAGIYQLEGDKILGACSLDIVEIALTGWLYGKVLNWVRRIHDELEPQP